jgi:MFS family permease
MFNALRSRNYRFYWGGQVISVMGQTMEHVALAWLVFLLTDSALSLGLSGLAQAAPRIVLSLIGGAVADRVDRQRLLIATQAVCGFLYFLIGFLVLTGMVQVWQVFAIAFIFGAVRSFDGPSRQAILPHVVDRANIPNAVALGNLAWEMPRLIGPAFAGILIALVGIGQTFLVAGCGFIIAAILFALMRLDAAAFRRSERSLARNMVDGLTYIGRNQTFMILIGLTFFNSAFGMSYQVLMPVFARDILNVGSEGLGVLHGFVGAGAIVGSIVAAVVAQSGGRGIRSLLGAIAFGLCIVGFAVSQMFLLSGMLLLLAAVASNVYMVSVNTMLQMRLPDEYRARVMGVWSMTWSLTSVGGMFAGGVAEIAGAPAAVALGGFLVAGMALVVAVGVPRIRQLD